MAGVVEHQRQRVEQEMTKVVDDLDKLYLRRMQADMHRCAAVCCDNQDSSLEGVQRCVENCSVPLSSAQNYIQKEIAHLQDRLQRCVMECNDDAKDKMGPNPTDDDVDKFTTMFEKCAVKCVDKHLALIPNFLSSVKAVLQKPEHFRQ